MLAKTQVTNKVPSSQAKPFIRGYNMKLGCVYSSLVECVLSMSKVLGSISTTKK
jgi:hypothetical protein